MNNKIVFTLMIALAVIAGIFMLFLSKNNFSYLFVADKPAPGIGRGSLSFQDYETSQDKILKTTSSLVTSPDFTVKNEEDFKNLVNFLNIKMYRRESVDGGYLRFFLGRVGKYRSEKQGEFLYEVALILETTPLSESAVVSVLNNESELGLLLESTKKELGGLGADPSKYLQVLYLKNLALKAQETYPNKYLTSKILAGIYVQSYLKKQFLLSSSTSKEPLALDVDVANAIQEQYNKSRYLNDDYLYNPAFKLRIDYYNAWYLYLANQDVGRPVDESIRLLERVINYKDYPDMPNIAERKAYARLYMAVIPFEARSEYAGLSVDKANELKLKTVKDILDPVFMSEEFTNNKMTYQDLKVYLKKINSGERGPAYDRLKPMLDFLIANDSQYKKINAL